MNDTQRLIRILIVDDQELVRSGFEILLNSQQDLHVIASAANGAEALDIIRTRSTEIDMVLLDIRMPVLDGLGVLRAARKEHALADLPFLILTTFDEEHLILGALRAGARGFLLKDASPAVLLEAVRTIAAGGAWLDPAITGTVLSHLGDAPDADSNNFAHSRTPAESAPTHHQQSSPINDALHEPLTDRERDVLNLVCEGLTNVAIGQRLFLAESTIKTHVKSILGKTGCSNRVELIVHAYRTNLVAIH
ncbi:response regulator transcription factor [Schaalia vaccimaxillae]|uniref:response regulator transcription factor n=1 Tax=Schaalia vaccimaxillae TaxID=183916 RepID=UPI00047DBD89|nr:response regulator transcription factor [Schaalia vaccimaxillae]